MAATPSICVLRRAGRRAPWPAAVGGRWDLVLCRGFADHLAFGDAAYGAFLDRADAYVEQKGLPLPVERQARARLADPSCVLQPTRQLDHRATGVSAVIWATGYTFDFSWIDLPVLNGRGEPKHDRGIAPIPGLYLGLPWLSKMNSSFLNGVGDDAARLAEHIRCGAAALSSMA